MKDHDVRSFCIPQILLRFQVSLLVARRTLDTRSCSMSMATSTRLDAIAGSSLAWGAPKQVPWGTRGREDYGTIHRNVYTRYQQVQQFKSQQVTITLLHY